LQAKNKNRNRLPGIRKIGKIETSERRAAARGRMTGEQDRQYYEMSEGDRANPNSVELKRRKITMGLRG
jgi:hypothetical protein